MSSVLEVQEFFVEGRDPDKAHVLLHIAEPTAPHEKERGYLFALVEVLHGHPEQIEAFQDLIDKIERTYYAEREKKDYLLERLLQNVNRESQHLLQYKDSSIHCIVGAIRDREIAIAYHGQPTAVLWYAGTERLESTPIIDGDGETGPENQLFSEIVEGAMNPGDFIYIATPHVADYFNLDRLGKIIESRTTRQSAAHIQKVLSDLASDYSFGGIVFHITDKTDTPKTGPLPKSTGHQAVNSGSEASLNHLIASAKTTEHTLSPPLLGDVSKTLKSMWHTDATTGPDTEPTPRPPRQATVETNHRTARKDSRDESWFGRFLIGVGRSLIFIVQGLGAAIWRLLVHFLRGGQTLVLFLTNRNNGRDYALKNWRSQWDDKKRFMRTLPAISKLILIGTLVLAVSFVGSLVYLKIKANRDTAAAQYQNLIQAITDKHDAAEASLIYGEKTKALQLMEEADKLLANLPSGTKQQAQKITDLTESFAAVREKLRNNTILHPELFVDLGSHQTAAGGTVNAHRLAKIGGTLIVFGPDDSNLYSVNLSTKQVETKPHETVKGLSAAVVPAEEDKMVFLTRDHAAAEYDPKTGAVTGKTIGFSTPTATIGPFGIYNRKLYVVDGNSKQIYKYTSTQTGYDKGTPWLKHETIGLETASAVAVDGDLYVATQTGSIRKFFTGEEQPFAVTGVDPTLANPNSMWTSSNTKELIILDPANKRVVVVDKTGAFIQQYTAGEWQQPTGLVVEDNGKTIYVLDGAKIYKFTR